MDSNTGYEMKMNKEYILKEGLLEAYFLGDLSKAEEQEVYEVLQKDPELMQQYRDLEANMEQLAFDNAQTPPNDVKEKLIQQIEESLHSQPKTKLIEPNFYKRFVGIAASLAALFMTATIILWLNLDKTQEELKVTLSKKEVLTDSINTLVKSNLKNQELISYVNSPETKRFLLKGNQLAPNAIVLSYVNHKEQSVLINIHKLPELEGKDYQMWADVKGKMINMGVIDSSKKMLAMNYIQNAESINITIEKKGGSDHPDVSKLIGSVSI